MPEKHIGTKFRTEFLPGKIEDPLAAELVQWCRIFDRLGLAPDYGRGSCGNLSYRTNDGFIITPTGAYFDSLKEDDLVKVIACDFASKKVIVAGSREPSSESMLHHEIYRRREDVRAVFHGHDDRIVQFARELGIVETPREQPYGSIELVQEVSSILEDRCSLVLKNHGFITLGKDTKEAGELALKMREAAVRLSRAKVQP